MKSLLKHSFWLAPLIAFVGFVSYFTVFVQFPSLRDVPWVNLPSVILASGFAVWGLVSNWSMIGNGRRILHLGGMLFAVGMAGLLLFYVFFLSYQMPGLSETTRQLEKAPNFTLSDANGEMVSLSDFRDKKVVLSFYRGFW